ncbi:ATP-dependent protease [Salinivibrio proteolyticus]|nr:ATP-dependent protease [Salinivibrio proteolyticus]
MPKPTNKSWYTLKNAGDNQPVKIWIHGDIGAYDIEAVDLIRALQAIGNDVDVELRVQCYGGSVYEGLALYNALKAHKGKVTAVVDGVVASIASYVLMACDEIHMPENASLMIHDPAIGAWGGEQELESALTQLRNARKTLADAYVEKSGKSEADVLAAMEKETWFRANEALEFGLIDKVIDPVDLTNCAVRPDALTAQFKHPPKELLNQLNPVPSEPPAPPANEPAPTPDPEPQPLAAQAAHSKKTQVSDDMPTPNTELQAAITKENQRQQAIRALCAQHKVSDTLRDEMLNDVNCDEAGAAQKILTNLGKSSVDGQDPTGDNGKPSPNLTNTHLHVGNGNITKDALQNALNSRCGVAEAEKDNPYKHKTLIDMAEIALGKEAINASSRSDLVARAFTSGDFADVITESVRTVMRDEAKVRAPLWRDLASTENLPNFKESELVMVNDAPDLMRVSEDGEYKSATLTGSGEKIQLATFGREIGFTRQAIINDEISLISKVPRKFMQAAYRLSDKLFFNAILSGKMADGNPVFHGANLIEGVKAADYQALITKLHRAFSLATTDQGDPLDLRGEVLIASPDHAPMLEAVLKTASKPDAFNPAYNKFKDIVETGHAASINGAIGLTSRDFETVLMGFLDGQQDPWLETGDGWTSDGAKFRITYDITSKVADRRGIAKATFA